jgi:hypothetical protein
MGKNILTLVILLATVSCGASRKRIQYEEKTDSSYLRIMLQPGPGYKYITIEKFVKGLSTYYLMHDCYYQSYHAEKKTLEKVNGKNIINYWIGVTDTTSSSVVDYGRTLSQFNTVKNKFLPISVEEKRLFGIASSKIKSDSCSLYNLTKLIGFIKKDSAIVKN